MSDDHQNMDESSKKEVLLKAISDAREAHPDCTIVYFVKHVQAPEALPKPTKKLYSLTQSACSSPGHWRLRAC